MSLQVWLPLISDIHNQGINNCIPESSNVTTNAAGKIGSCQYLSGAATSYINTNYSTNIGTNDFSIAMWLKLPTISSGSYFAICSSKTASAASAGFGIYWNYSQKKFLWSTADGSAGTEIWMATAVDSIVYDKWIHLVMVRNNNDSKKGYFYINGTRYELASVPVIRNITTDTKMHIGKCTNGSYPTKMYINDFRIYDHALSAAEVKEISQGLVLHYPLNRNSLKPIGTNLVTGVTKGGQTTLLTDGRVGVVTSGTSADTYFTVNLSESITNGTTYYLSCDVSGVSDGQYWGFPLGAQSNTSMPSKFYNGHNEYIFTANDINWGTNRLFLDDNYRNDYAHPASFYNFVLIKNPTFEEVDGSGFGHNSTSNAPITTSEDTGRYEEASYFGAYNTPVLTVNNFSAIAPALTSCTITWWGKYDTTKTLLFTGHTTSYYLAASNNNTYYHGNGGTITFYKDGIAGTYKCAADGWHHFAMTGVNLSSWTALKLNGYSSSWPLNGYISDLRIYNTILSADDILQLYHTSAKVDNLGGFHTFELSETNNGLELLAVPLTTSYGNHTNIYTEYDSNGEITMTGGSSIGSYYIPINPSGKTYYYDIEVSTDSGNVFYIGFQRYDANKTARSNDATVYLSGLGGSSEARTHKHYHGTVDLSTDGVNPCAFTSLRILNDWSGANSRHATIHKISLREVSTLQNTKINKQGQTITTELIEMNDKFRVQKNGIIETNEIIEL